MTTYKWQFAPRFRRNAFGWKSDTPIQRIKEALAELKAIAMKEPVLAAEGAVLFLGKVAPAIEQVDSSSGGIGSAVWFASTILAGRRQLSWPMKRVVVNPSPVSIFHWAMPALSWLPDVGNSRH